MSPLFLSVHFGRLAPVPPLKAVVDSDRGEPFEKGEAKDEKAVEEVFVDRAKRGKREKPRPFGGERKPGPV